MGREDGDQKLENLDLFLWSAIHTKYQLSRLSRFPLHCTMVGTRSLTTAENRRESARVANLALQAQHPGLYDAPNSRRSSAQVQSDNAAIQQQRADVEAATTARENELAEFELSQKRLTDEVHHNAANPPTHRPPQKGRLPKKRKPAAKPKPATKSTAVSQKTPAMQEADNDNYEAPDSAPPEKPRPKPVLRFKATHIPDHTPVLEPMDVQPMEFEKEVEDQAELDVDEQMGPDISEGISPQYFDKYEAEVDTNQDAPEDPQRGEIPEEPSNLMEINEDEEEEIEQPEPNGTKGKGKGKLSEPLVSCRITLRINSIQLTSKCQFLAGSSDSHDFDIVHPKKFNSTKGKMTPAAKPITRESN